MSVVREDRHSGPPVTLSAHFHVTEAYPPSYLKTVSRGCNYNRTQCPLSPLHVSDLIDPRQDRATDQGCFRQFDRAGGGNGPLVGTNPNDTDVAAKPVLSYSPDIPNLNSAWKDCHPIANVLKDYVSQLASDNGEGGNIGLLPVFHIPVSGPLTPTAPSSTRIASMTSSAQPGAHIQDSVPASVTPYKTTTPETAMTEAHFNPVAEMSTSTSNRAIGANPSSGVVGPLPGVITIEALPEVIATAGHQQVYILPNGDVSVAGAIITKGGPAVIIDNTPVSADADAVYIGTSTLTRPSPLPQPDSGQRLTNDPLEAPEAQIANDPPDILGQPMEAGANGAVVIGSSTVPVGQQETVDGTIISVGSSNVVVGPSTYEKPTFTGSAAISASPYRPLFVNGKTIDLPVLPTDIIQALGVTTMPADAQTTISGIPISVGTDVIVIGTSTYALPIPTDSAIFRAPNGAVVVDGKTLSEGTQVTVSGTPISIGSSIAEVGGKTYVLPVFADPAVPLANNGAVVVSGKTLSEGMQVTVSGTPVSLGSTKVVIGSNTYGLPLPTNPAVSLVSNSALVLDGMTLVPGALATLSGTTVSVGSDNIVVGSKTYALPASTNAPTATESNLGAIIGSMFGYDPSTADGANPALTSASSSEPVNGNGSSTMSLALFTGAGSRPSIDALVLMITTGLLISSHFLTLIT